MSVGAVGAPAGARRGALVWLPSGLLILFLLLDGVIKLVPIQPVVDTVLALGWPADAATLRVLGALLIGATLL
jgi:hypothetical protein